MKQLIAIVFFIFITCNVVHAQFRNDSIVFFMGINPIAPFTSLPNQFTNLYLPLASNLETGLALNGGIVLERSILELRLSYGNPNNLYRLFQFHLGYNYFISKNNDTKGFYVSGFAKYYRIQNRMNHICHSSIIPYLCVGYRIKKRNIFIDCRLNQNIYSISWSNQENTSLNSDFHFSVYDDISPVLPYLSINVGYTFLCRKK